MDSEHGNGVPAYVNVDWQEQGKIESSDYRGPWATELENKSGRKKEFEDPGPEDEFKFFGNEIRDRIDEAVGVEEVNHSGRR